jgi:hypothetical protein
MLGFLKHFAFFQIAARVATKQTVFNPRSFYLGLLILYQVGNLLYFENSLENHYQTLNVLPSAKLGSIKQSYRSLSLTLHPDKGGNDFDFLHVKHAYQVLKAKRSIYNVFGDLDCLHCRTYRDAFYVNLMHFAMYWSTSIAVLLLLYVIGNSFYLKFVLLLFFCSLELYVVNHSLSILYWRTPHEHALLLRELYIAICLSLQDVRIKTRSLLMDLSRVNNALLEKLRSQKIKSD